MTAPNTDTIAAATAALLTPRMREAFATLAPGMIITGHATTLRAMQRRGLCRNPLPYSPDEQSAHLTDLGRRVAAQLNPERPVLAPEGAQIMVTGQPGSGKSILDAAKAAAAAPRAIPETTWTSAYYYGLGVMHSNTAAPVSGFQTEAEVSLFANAYRDHHLGLSVDEIVPVVEAFGNWRYDRTIA